jgi:hypothetical protein
MEKELLICRFCGAEPGPSTPLDQCDVCEAWVCQRCGGVRFDEEAHGIVCWPCFQAIHPPIRSSPEPTEGAAGDGSRGPDPRLAR